MHEIRHRRDSQAVHPIFKVLSPTKFNWLRAQSDGGPIRGPSVARPVFAALLACDSICAHRSSNLDRHFAWQNQLVSSPKPPAPTIPSPLTVILPDSASRMLCSPGRHDLPPLETFAVPVFHP